MLTEHGSMELKCPDRFQPACKPYTAASSEQVVAETPLLPALQLDGSRWFPQCVERCASTRPESSPSPPATSFSEYDCLMATTPSTPEGATSESLTPLDVSAISLHEAYLAFRRAGFDDRRALKIIAYMATNRG